MGAKNKHDFWKSPGGNFVSPGSPKMITNQQDNLRTEKQQKTDNLQQITYRRSSKGNLLMDCVLGEGRRAVSNANTPRAPHGPVRIFGAVWGEGG